MILRWTVTAVTDAATRFRRVVGARQAMTKLVLALRALDGKSNAVEPKKKVA